MAGTLLVLCGCAQPDAGNPAPSAPARAGVVHVAASETCAPGSGPTCAAVGGEHVLVTPSDFTALGVATASAAGDDRHAVDVVFDSAGAATLEAVSRTVAGKGDNGRLVLRVKDRVISAVRVPGAVSVTTMRLALPDHLDAQDVAQQITHP